ncbi:small subunit ribosomal protein S8e [Nematocida sp. AWRm80]|nr:small subunit ribosomal protein S8e [Nematocida sp. AWRm80]
MGLTRSGKHKRKNTGGRRTASRIPRLHCVARQPSNTKVGPTKVKHLRVRGGSHKLRAIRLENGSFVIKTHGFASKSAIQQVVYHASNNELIRTNTLTKGCIVKIDPTPFEREISKILEKEPELQEIDPMFFEEFKQGNLYAAITSRPGQCGTADGHILQANELAFYAEKFKAKKKK